MDITPFLGPLLALTVLAALALKTSEILLDLALAGCRRLWQICTENIGREQ